MNELPISVLGKWFLERSSWGKAVSAEGQKCVCAISFLPSTQPDYQICVYVCVTEDWDYKTNWWCATLCVWLRQGHCGFRCLEQNEMKIHFVKDFNSDPDRLSASGFTPIRTLGAGSSLWLPVRTSPAWPLFCLTALCSNVPYYERYAWKFVLIRISHQERVGQEVDYLQHCSVSN